jgi:hypothetical protein
MRAASNSGGADQGKEQNMPVLRVLVRAESAVNVDSLGEVFQREFETSWVTQGDRNSP